MPRPVFWVLFVPVMLWIVLCVILGLSIIVTGRQDNPSQSDVIVVLGAGLEMDQPTANFRDRAKHGATMWHAGWAPNVLCTGAVTGIDDTRSEASACREMLLAEGVTAEAIFMEEKSRSTEENAIYSAEMMTAQGWQSALVVSSSYHLFRAC